MKSHLVFLCIVAAIAVGSATDYCSKYCERNGQKIQNIGCKNNKQFQASCPKDAKLIPFTDAMKKVVVDAHNKNRNAIAGGELKNYRPACRMTTMEWDDELAQQAELHVKRCEFEHDQCHITDDFKYSGQNLFLSFEMYIDLDPEELAFVVDAWFDEHKDASQAAIDCFPSNRSKNLPMIGHFTIIAADHNTRVGCAAVTYDQVKKYILVTCNYATVYFGNFPIYTSCDKAASSCQSGTNPKYPNLCSASEKFDINQLDFKAQKECLAKA